MQAFQHETLTHALNCNPLNHTKTFMMVDRQTEEEAQRLEQSRHQCVATAMGVGSKENIPPDTDDAALPLSVQSHPGVNTSAKSAFKTGSTLETANPTDASEQPPAHKAKLTHSGAGGVADTTNGVSVAAFSAGSGWGAMQGGTAGWPNPFMHPAVGMAAGAPLGILQCPKCGGIVAHCINKSCAITSTSLP